MVAAHFTGADGGDVVVVDSMVIMLYVNHRVAASPCTFGFFPAGICLNVRVFVVPAIGRMCMGGCYSQYKRILEITVIFCISANQGMMYAVYSMQAPFRRNSFFSATLTIESTLCWKENIKKWLWRVSLTVSRSANICASA